VRSVIDDIGVAAKTVIGDKNRRTIQKIQNIILFFTWCRYTFPLEPILPENTEYCIASRKGVKGEMN